VRVLAVDIGHGTTDVLVYDSALPIENCPKLVFPSATRQAAARIRAATAAGRHVAFEGVTMGGGPSGSAMREHLRAGLGFYASPAAALSFLDDLDELAGLGVSITDTPAVAAGESAVVIPSGDLDPDALLAALAGLGIDTGFDGAAIAVQDHGFAPGESNRRFRFAMWETLLEDGGGIDRLAFSADAIPDRFTRMRAAASLASGFGRVIVMDTGPSAIAGALSQDITGISPRTRLVANAGNGHTLAALVTDGDITALVEHHTGMLDAVGFGEMVRGFLSGRLTNDDVFGAGGHGCLPPAQPVSLEESGPVLLTGPRRDRFRGCGLELEYAAPYGDMMLTGCFGLLGAWLRLA